MCNKQTLYGLVALHLVLMHANNKGADQPAHPDSLISTVVVHFSEKSKITPCNKIDGLQIYGKRYDVHNTDVIIMTHNLFYAGNEISKQS